MANFGFSIDQTALPVKMYLVKPCGLAYEIEYNVSTLKKISAMNFFKIQSFR